MLIVHFPVHNKQITSKLLLYNSTIQLSSR